MRIKVIHIDSRGPRTGRRPNLRIHPVTAAIGILCLAAAPAFAQQATQSLSEVTIAEQNSGTDTVRSYENPEVTSATGLVLTRRQTPQSVSVLTRQQLDDEAAVTLDDALLYATGITAVQNDVAGRVSYRSRGYAITNYNIDGAKVNGETSFSGQGLAINMDLYDRIEVLRGASGLAGNTGDPSGSINLVRKQPQKHFFGSASVQTGSWDKKHLMADLNTPFNTDGSARGRFVVSLDDSDGFRDRERNRAEGALANLAFDLGRDTTLGLGATYERTRFTGATWGTNVPIWYADGTNTDFPRSLSASPSWSVTERETRTAFASLEHRLANQWTTRLNASYSEGEAMSHIGVAKANTGGTPGNSGFWNQDGTGAYLNTIFSESETYARNFAWTLNGPWQLAGRSQQFMAGINGTDTKTTTYGLACADATGTALACMNRITSRVRIGNWKDFIATGNDGIGPITATRTGIDTSTRIKNYGGYVANRFSVTAPLAVIVGARVGYQTSYSNDAVTSAFRHEITPYLGATYDIDSNYSLYASYTSIFDSQAYRKVNGDYVDPKTGRAFEVGVKGEWLDGQIDGGLALFYNKQRSVATIDRDADGNTRYVNDNQAEGTAYFNGASGVRTKGIDLDFSGRFTPNWNVYGGYTFLSVDNPNAAGTDNDPRHLLRLNTSYRLASLLPKLTIGGGLTSQSAMRQAPTGTSHPTLGANVNINLQGYTLLHAMARYQFTDKVVGTLNITNLTDKTYYRQYGFYSGAIYGEPRRITVGVNVKF